MSATISDRSVFGMSLCLAVLGRLMRSLGQAPISARSESDWIHFVTPCHRKETTLQADHLIISVSILPPERMRSNPLVVVLVRMADEKALDVSELESEFIHTLSDKRDILLKIVVYKDVPLGVAIR